MFHSVLFTETKRVLKKPLGLFVRFLRRRADVELGERFHPAETRTSCIPTRLCRAHRCRRGNGSGTGSASQTRGSPLPLLFSLLLRTFQRLQRCPRLWRRAELHEETRIRKSFAAIWFLCGQQSSLTPQRKPLLEIWTPAETSVAPPHHPSPPMNT